MTNLSGLVLRPARSDEEAWDAISPIVQVEEAWFIDKNIISIYRKFDTDCMIIALLDHQPVGCVLAPTWDTTTGGIAFLGVHSEHRKSGIAAQLGATAIARIRSSICITSLPVNVPAYEKQGFVEGSGIQYWKFSGSLPQPKGKVSEEPPTVSELAKIDTAYTGLDRGRLWQCFIDQKSRFLSIHAGDKLVAWTIVHSFDQQCTLAPLYAETKDQARDLVLRAVEMSDELVIEADSTENAEEVFGELGFEKTIQAVYMWKGMPKLPDQEKVYAGLQGF